MNVGTKIACYECGAPVEPVSWMDKKFCCRAHKDTFINRRKLRGAALIDLIMAMRFDRQAAKEFGAWSVVCRMASNWREEDREAGRVSMMPLNESMERHVQHKAVRGRVSRIRR